MSLTFRPGDGHVRGRKIAVLIAPGVDAQSVAKAQAAITGAGAMAKLVAVRLGPVEAADGTVFEPDVTFETAPSVTFDAVVVADGEAAADELGSLGHALEFLKDQYRHCKPIALLGTGEAVANEAGVPTDDETDWAIVREMPSFMDAVSKYRNWDRAIDPPPV